MSRKRPPGVRRLPSGRYQARPTIAGQQLSLGTYPTVKEAADAIEQARVDARHGQFVHPTTGNIPLAQYGTTWLEARLSINDRTVKGYRTAIGRLGWLGQVALSDVTPAQYRKRIAEWAEQYAPATVHLTHVQIKAILQAAVNDQLIVRNPAAHPSVELPKGGRTKPRRYLTYDEVTHVTAVMSDMYADLVWTMVWTGFRLQEALGLRPVDIDITGRVINLSEQWSYTRKRHVPLKGRSDETDVRHTPIVQELETVLRRRMDVAGQPYGLLFPSPGRPLQAVHGNSVRLAIDEACERSGVERFTPHDLRHSCASWLHAVGVSLPEAAAWLGHRDASITARTYTHLWPRQLEGAAEKLGGVSEVDLGSGVTRIRKAE